MVKNKKSVTVSTRYLYPTYYFDIRWSETKNKYWYHEIWRSKSEISCFYLYPNSFWSSLSLALFLLQKYNHNDYIVFLNHRDKSIENKASVST